MRVRPAVLEHARRPQAKPPRTRTRHSSVATPLVTRAVCSLGRSAGARAFRVVLTPTLRSPAAARATAMAMTTRGAAAAANASGSAATATATATATTAVVVAAAARRRRCSHARTPVLTTAAAAARSLAAQTHSRRANVPPERRKRVFRVRRRGCMLPPRWSHPAGATLLEPPRRRRQPHPPSRAAARS